MSLLKLGDFPTAVKVWGPELGSSDGPATSPDTHTDHPEIPFFGVSGCDISHFRLIETLCGDYIVELLIVPKCFNRKCRGRVASSVLLRNTGTEYNLGAL